MNISQTKAYSSSRLAKMMMLCIGSTGFAMFALLVAAVLPGSPTGGPDGPLMIAFLLLIVFLYVILPMHVIGSVATIFKYFTTDNRTRFIFPLLYFVVWFLALFLYLVLSGAAEPVFEEINARKLRGQHATEMALLSALRQSRDHSAVPALITQVSDIDLTEPEFGLTALQWAARGASTDIVKKLLDAGADLNVRYSRNWSNGRGTLKNATVLDIAAWSDVERKEKTLLLLDRGAVPTAQALVGACAAGDIELIEKYQTLEIDIQTAAEGEGLSCFHMAAQNGDVNLIEALFSMGIVPNAVSKYKLTPVDLARAKNRGRAAIALLKGGAPANQPNRLIDLVAHMPQEDFDLAVSHGPLLDLKPADARRALSEAVSGCDVSIVRRLFAAGLTPERRYREVIEIPAECEFHELMLEIVRPASGAS